jgi:hypothetical protein
METDIDTDMDMDKETDMDKDMGMELEYYRWISIRPYRCYSAVWTTCDTARRKLHQCYKLVAPLPNENYDMLIFKNSYRYWGLSPNDVLAELEMSVWSKAATKSRYSKWKLIYHI